MQVVTVTGKLLEAVFCETNVGSVIAPVLQHVFMLTAYMTRQSTRGVTVQQVAHWWHSFKANRPDLFRKDACKAGHLPSCTMIRVLYQLTPR